MIAAIRRDFGQLAALMGAADDSPEQQAESRRLREQAQARVIAFLMWLSKAPDILLTQAELHSLLSLVEPGDALAIMDTHRAVLSDHVEGAGTELYQVRQELADATGKELPRFSRIILYIDDLDRCPPKTVVSVLQAVHLLLCFPLFTVVVAVDARWVSRALKEEFPNLLAETGMFADVADASGRAGANSHDYLEKIFQIPYWVRPINAEAAARYVNNLVESDLRRSVVDADPDTAEAEAATVAQRSPATASGVAPAALPRSGSEAPAVQGSTLTAPTTTGLELTRWETDALERFAPLVGATPRRLIRFVNVYRLIKTSLPATLFEGFVGQNGEGKAYRSLIAQLAIVTGAPDASMSFFNVIASCKPTQTLSEMMHMLKNDDQFKGCSDSRLVEEILDQTIEWPGSPLLVEHLTQTASIARRYSFTARQR